MSALIKAELYTGLELINMLKDRQGGMSQVHFAAELGISPQFLSQIYTGQRSVGMKKILDYLAPAGKEFRHVDNWVLVKK